MFIKMLIVIVGLSMFLFSEGRMISGTSFAKNVYYLWDYKKMILSYDYVAIKRPLKRAILVQTPTLSFSINYEKDSFALNYFGFFTKGLVVDSVARSLLKNWNKKRISDGLYTHNYDMKQWVVPFELTAILIDNTNVLSGSPYGYLNNGKLKIRYFNHKSGVEEEAIYSDFAKKMLVTESGFSSGYKKYFNTKIVNYLKYLQLINRGIVELQKKRGGVVVRVEVEKGKVYFPDIAPRDKEPPVISLLLDNAVFSPDGDGVKDDLKIDLNIKDSSEIKEWTISIFRDMNKSSISSLVKTTPFKEYRGLSKSKTVRWDGYSGTNEFRRKKEMVDSAEDYAIVITASDVLGNKSSVKKRVTVDILVHSGSYGKKIIINSIQFASGSAVLGKKYFPVLNKVSKILKKFSGYKIKVVGHTDSTGSKSVNMSLSDKRANSVVKYLISKVIAKDNLEHVGKGSEIPQGDENVIVKKISEKEKLLKKEKNPETNDFIKEELLKLTGMLTDLRSRNRRVEFYLVK